MSEHHLSTVPTFSLDELDEHELARASRRREWERCLATVAAMRVAFYDVAPPDVQAAFDVLARLKVPR